MEKEKQNNKYDLSNYSFTMVPDYFFRKLIKVMGAIPSMVYLSLLSYCHKKKYIAWPSLNTMSQETGMAKTTIIRNLNILIKQNFIKNIAKDKSCKNYYHHNVYQIVPPEKIFLSHFSDAKKNVMGGSVAIPSGFQNATSGGSVAIPRLVAECYPNNNNLNNNNITTTKEGKDAVVVNFKKLKEKGEKKMQAVREQLRDLDIEGKFIEQLLKDYPLRKIEEKIDLLMERKNIQNPAGWLRSALKNDYQDPEQERYDEEPAEGSDNLKCRGTMHRALNESGRINPSPTKNINTPEQASRLSTENKKILSREEALKQIHLAKQRLAAIIPSYQMEGRLQKKEGEKR